MSTIFQDQITQKTLDCILCFLCDHVMKKGFKKVILGLSGGIDSAVVALLCKQAFGDCMLAVCMPSSSSNPSHLQDAIMLSQDFNIPYEIHSIAPYEEIFLQQHPDILRRGNFCARMRMNLLYDLSQKHQALVIGTSNKSELMLGYGTIYGDLACAINPIAPFYKTQIFEIAKLLGMPETILNKAPSADLYPHQEDAKDLGYDYHLIDPLLFCIAQHFPTLQNIDKDFLLQKGFESSMIESITQRITQNLFKQSLPLFLEI